MTRNDRAWTKPACYTTSGAWAFSWPIHARTRICWPEPAATAFSKKSGLVWGSTTAKPGGRLARNLGFPDDLRHVVVTNHAALRQGVFETADLVRVAVLMTDGLGFAFVPLRPSQFALRPPEPVAP